MVAFDSVHGDSVEGGWGKQPGHLTINQARQLWALRGKNRLLKYGRGREESGREELHNQRRTILHYYSLTPSLTYFEEVLSRNIPNGVIGAFFSSPTTCEIPVHRGYQPSAQKVDNDVRSFF